MSESAEHTEVLDELIAQGMQMVRAIQAKAAEAETIADMSHAAMAFDRVSRSVRMAIALSHRLAHDAEKREREALRQGEEIRKALDSRIETRKQQVRQQLAPLGEELVTYEGEKAFREHLRLVVEKEAWAADFMTAPIEDCLERVRKGLDLPHIRRLDRRELISQYENEVQDLQRQKASGYVIDRDRMAALQATLERLHADTS